MPQAVCDLQTGWVAPDAERLAEIRGRPWDWNSEAGVHAEDLRIRRSSDQEKADSPPEMCSAMRVESIAWALGLATSGGTGSRISVLGVCRFSMGLLVRHAVSTWRQRSPPPTPGLRRMQVQTE